MVTRGLHIVQVGYDDNVFVENAPLDSLERQVNYGRILERKHPGSRISNLIFTSLPSARRFEVENVAFIPVKGKRFWYLIKIYPRLVALHRELSIDAITTQTIFDEAWIALLFGKIHRVKVIGQVHFDISSPIARQDMLGGGLKTWVRTAIGFRLMKHLFAVRVVGQRMRREILAKNLHNNAHVLPVFVTIHANVSQVRNISTQKILFVGQLVFAKNLDDWLRVASIIAGQKPDVVFEIVGDGPMRSRLENLAKQLRIAERVNFRGFVPYDELPKVYATSTVFLFTSKYEGFGRVVVESYLHRIPVVATRITGVEDIVDNGISGFLHESGDIEGLASSVIKLLDDEELRNRMGAAGRELVKSRFDPERLSEAWIDLLASAAPERNPVVISPLRATFSRWKKLSSTKYSLLRGLEYERIEGLTLKGRTLDVGGGRRVSYLHLLKFEGDIESVNIDAKTEPTAAADLNHPLPFRSECYDNVICFNTLEHISNDTLAVSEIVRMLKPGGHFHITVPFIYRVHSSPYDYHRHTPEWWTETFFSLGIKPENLTIEPLIWDTHSSGYSLIEFTRFRRIKKPLVMLRAVLSHARWRGSERLPENIGRNYADFALGYYISGVK
ncbi:MAG: glycosyltransferase [bacterium]